MSHLFIQMKIMSRSAEFFSSTDKTFFYSTVLLIVKLKIDTMLKNFCTCQALLTNFSFPLPIL